MGLLLKTEAARHTLLRTLTSRNKKYIEEISSQRRDALQKGIQKQRLGLSARILRLSRPTSRAIHMLRKRLPPKRHKPRSRTSTLPPQPQYPQVKTRGQLQPSQLLQPPKASLSNVPAVSETRFPEPRLAEIIIPTETAEYMITGIPGFDGLLQKGIPKGAAVLVAGGAGSGKTIFGLQLCAYHASRGKKCLYLTFEESEEKLLKHMENFGWSPQKLLPQHTLLITRVNPFEITRIVDALVMQAQGELLIPLEPMRFPHGFRPDIVVVDSLTAISSAFGNRSESYRLYIEQLFRFFEKLNATSFLITETEQVPRIFSTSGVEEFLADMVIVLYNIRHTHYRERAIEVLKLRGAGHLQRIVAMSITAKGIEVFPQQEIFSEIEEK